MEKPVDSKLNCKNLKTVSKLLYENTDHDWFIFYGTMLGYCRNGKIIETDDDVDFLVDIAAYDDVVRMVKSTPYTISLNMKKNNFLQILMRYGETMTYVDFYFYTTHPNKPESIFDKWSSIQANTVMNSHIPKSLVFPIRTVDMMGIELNVPQNVDDCCKLVYGLNYMTPMVKNSGSYNLYEGLR